jgi:hypothetical protein
MRGQQADEDDCSKAESRNGRFWRKAVVEALMMALGSLV